MNKREAKIEALQIATVVIYELIASDCTDSELVKNELYEISIQLNRRTDRLKAKR